MDYPSNRADAKASGAKYYFTGKPCKQGHISIRKTKGICVACMKEDTKKAAIVRADYFTAYNHREEVKTKKNKWYQKNRDRVISAALATPKEKQRQYRQAWKDKYPDLRRADTSYRRKRHKDATPPWLTKAQKQEIKDIYKEAMELTRTTGIKHAVDHIWPLRHSKVCGLHVPWNLRILTREVNLEKSNKLPGIEEGLAFL